LFDEIDKWKLKELKQLLENIKIMFENIIKLYIEKTITINTFSSQIIKNSELNIWYINKILENNYFKSVN
jgi:hypothetical protein